MDIEFDPAKDQENRRRHGVSLALSGPVLATMVTQFEDDRRDYGETRMVALGFIGPRLYVCVYTLRGEVRRVISLRKANRREQARWAP